MLTKNLPVYPLRQEKHIIFLSKSDDERRGQWYADFACMTGIMLSTVKDAERKQFLPSVGLGYHGEKHGDMAAP